MTLWELLLCIIIGVLIGTLLILVADQMLFRMTEVTATVQPPA